MRRIIHAMGVVALVAIIAGGIGLGVLISRGNALDTESRSFVDRAVPAIVANWDVDELLTRATPELRASVRPEQRQALSRSVSPLGPLVTYGGAKGQSFAAYTTGGGATVTAAYVATATFRHGTATIQLALVKRDGRWMINGFHVDTTLTGPPVQGA